MKQRLYWVGNRDTKRAEVWTHIRYWEELQGAAMCGIGMIDGNSANQIGRCRDLADFIRRANHSGVTILVSDEAKPGKLTIEVHQSQCEVTADIWLSWTGKRFIDGLECKGERFMLGTFDTYTGKIAA